MHSSGEDIAKDDGPNLPVDNRSAIQSIIWPAVQIGILTGSSGVAVGGVLGVMRSSSPPLTATAFGIHWFLLGSIFWGSRESLFQSRRLDSLVPNDRLYASAIAGGFAGGLLGMIARGRRHIVPGAITHSMVCCLGQTVYNSANASHAQRTAAEGVSEKALWERVLNSRWSPMKVLSDEEYEAMLRERLLRVNAEIAITEEDIQRLRESERSKASS